MDGECAEDGSLRIYIVLYSILTKRVPLLLQAKIPLLVLYRTIFAKSVAGVKQHDF